MDEQVVTREATSPERTGRRVFPTARFGDVTVAANTLLQFPRGIVGLPDARRFVLLHDEGSPAPVSWLQSLDDPALAFLVCDPTAFFPDYEIELTPAERALLALEDVRDALVRVILAVPEDPAEITANLRGPIVIHSETRTGVQLVLDGAEHSAREPLLAATRCSGRGGSKCSS